MPSSAEEILELDRRLNCACDGIKGFTYTIYPDTYVNSNRSEEKETEYKTEEEFVEKRETVQKR